MTEFRKNIDERIREKRPNLGASSVKTYVSILSNLHKNLKASNEDFDWFDKEEKENYGFFKRKAFPD
jgi:hypothetical protein